MTRLLPLGLVLGLAACASWPDEGQGGLAEIRQPSATAEVALEARLACALRRVSVLEAASRELNGFRGRVNR